MRVSFVSDLRVVLEGRDFRRLFGTRLVSQSSDGIFQFAVAGFAFFNPETSTSAVEIAAGLGGAAPAVLDPRPLRGRVHRPLVPAADPGHRANGPRGAAPGGRRARRRGRPRRGLLRRRARRARGEPVLPRRARGVTATRRPGRPADGGQRGHPHLRHRDNFRRPGRGLPATDGLRFRPPGHGGAAGRLRPHLRAQRTDRQDHGQGASRTGLRSEPAAGPRGHAQRAERPGRRRAASRPSPGRRRHAGGARPPIGSCTACARRC